jgi:hypothetical protein
VLKLQKANDGKPLVGTCLHASLSVSGYVRFVLQRRKVCCEAAHIEDDDVG